MGIFKDITKVLKKAAPVIGAGIGMYYGGAFGAALGSGLASSATGRSTEESLRNAALAGGTAYAIGGAGSMGGGTENFNTANSPLRGLFADTSVADTAIKSNTGGSSGIMGALTKNPLLTASLASATLPLFMKEKAQEEAKMDPYATGKSRLGVGSVGNASYDLNDDDQRLAYFDAVRKRQGIDTLNANAGGEVKGPGTGTSDSVPARLSDGEFVVTADAVRGAGGGDRDVGAARMYDMMSQLERAA
tara:strand:+ start:1060 stop:1800 length:741 start_codon:yes stop_codon:yes gene_type:complete